MSSVASEKICDTFLFIRHAGIVRLWDVQVNADGEKRQNGIALGEASYAISAMSLGARPDADHPLVLCVHSFLFGFRAFY